jgi:hypothetical protein
MIPSYRHDFNSRFTPDKYERLQREMTSRCGMKVPFALCETPCFFPDGLVALMGEDGKALIRQLVDNPEYRPALGGLYSRCVSACRMKRLIPCSCAGGLWPGSRCRRASLQPKLVELQAFPSLYAYQPVLWRKTYMDVFGLDPNLRYFLSGLDSAWVQATSCSKPSSQDTTRPTWSSWKYIRKNRKRARIFC